MFKTAKFQIRQRRYQPNLSFDFGGNDYWRFWILAGTALAVLNFGVCGCRPAYHYIGSVSVAVTNFVVCDFSRLAVTDRRLRRWRL